MAGILDFLGLGSSPALQPVQTSAGLIAPPDPITSNDIQGGGGIGGWLTSSPPPSALTVRSPTRLGIIGATLQDAAAQLAGKPDRATNLATVQDSARRSAINDEIRKAYASGDPQQLKQAVMDAVMADPEGAGHIISAITDMQPKVVTGSANGLYFQDRFGSGLKQAVPPQAKPPQTRTVQQGTDVITQQFNPTTGAWTQIGKGPKFEPKEPKIDPSTGGAPPPYSLFGTK